MASWAEKELGCRGVEKCPKPRQSESACRGCPRHVKIDIQDGAQNLLAYVDFLLEQYDMQKKGLKQVKFQGCEVFHLRVILSEMDTFAREIAERKRELEEKE